MNALFVDLLKNEYLKRVERNPSYSMRAYAKSLGVHQSYLSRILSGQRGLSSEITHSLSEKLNLKKEEVLKLALASEVTRRTANFRRLMEEDLMALNEWYYFAILEIVDTKGFRADTKWIAKKLGISQNSVKIAIEKLIQTGHLEIDDKNQWTVLTPASDWTDTKKSNTHRRKLQKSILSRAQEALDITPIEKREQASLTISCDSDKLDLIKLKIQNFKEELREVCAETKNKDEVYQLSISFFPLTQEDSK